MNAKETMQALLDGKTLIHNKHGVDVRYRLDDEGNLLHIYEGNQRVLNSWTLSDLEIYDEYPLTFEQALREMLDGKVVTCREPFPKYVYRFHNGRFESAHESNFFTKWEQESMPSFMQNIKWKVVG